MTRTTVRWRTWSAVAAVTALLVLSACGGEDDSASPVEAGNVAPLDPDAQALVFAECVRENGVDMPDPAPGQQGLVEAFQSTIADHDQATIERVFAACESHLPQYRDQDHDPRDDDWVLALAECLREQGLDVSDQPMDDFHSGRFDEAELQAAMAACRNVVSGGGQ